MYSIIAEVPVATGHAIANRREAKTEVYYRKVYILSLNLPNTFQHLSDNLIRIIKKYVLLLSSRISEDFVRDRVASRRSTVAPYPWIRATVTVHRGPSRRVVTGVLAS